MLLLPAPTLRNDIYSMESLDFLRALPDESVNLIVTSPPYFGCRDYGIDNQIGLERSIYLYVDRLVMIFRECRRALRKDGLMFVNIADSYNNYKANTGGSDYAGHNGHNSRPAGYGLEEKSLPAKTMLLIPQRLSLALLMDGWLVRNEVVWEKPNTKPESMKDRFTRSHEMVYVFSKTGKHYFNQDAVREPLAPSTMPRMKRGVAADNKYSKGAQGQTKEGLFNARKNGEAFPHINPRGRNKRTVWRIATNQYRSNHYAAFPEALVEPMILAGSRPGDLVLDPFMGSGTTAVVARRLRRDYVGCDLNPTYVTIASERLAQPDAPKPVRKPKPVQPVQPIQIRIGELVFQQTSFMQS